MAQEINKIRIGIVASHIHFHGGMERAAAEVFERIAKHHAVTAFATECEIKAPGLNWIPIHPLSKPAILRHWSFRRKVLAVEPSADCTITNSIGAAAIDADVITAQFCHAAFTRRHGGLRGGTSLGRSFYQKWAQNIYTEQERYAYTSPRLKGVIAVSKGVKRELIEYYKVPPEKIIVIPNAVDHSVFHPAVDSEAKQKLRHKLNLPAQGFLCLFVGGDWDRKGLADAILAIQGVPNTYLIVVGKGDTLRFSSVATEAGVADKVIFAGHSTRTQDYYAAADVFMFPSRYEAFSLVTLEAVASGLPIIALPINGTEELIEEGVNGFFAEPNPSSFRNKLLCMQADPARFRAMSEAAVYSSLPYSWDRIAAEQMCVFEKVAQQNLLDKK